MRLGRARSVVAPTPSSTRSTSASFADGNGDGIGDLAGVRARLPYLAKLGVDAIWFTPWYVSPLADGGYDVADYRAIDPAFGTLAEAERLIVEARDLGIRTIVDIVPNHVSDRHAWFQAALAAEPGLARTRKVLVPPGSRRGRQRDAQRLGLQLLRARPGPGRMNPDGTPGEWYLHLFSARAARSELGPPGRPRRARGGPEVLARPRRGGRPDRLGGTAGQGPRAARGARRARPGRASQHRPRRAPRDLPRLARRSRLVLRRPHPGRRALAARHRALREVPPARRAPHRLQLRLPGPAVGRGEPARRRSTPRLAAHAPVGRSGDVGALQPRRNPTGDPLRAGGHVLRLRQQARGNSDGPRTGSPARPRAAALLCAALPGSLYIYQGEELGLEEVQDLPAHQRQDPMYLRSGGTDPGRDGCRVPLPWAGTARRSASAPPARRRSRGCGSRAAGPASLSRHRSTIPNSMLEPLPERCSRIRRDEPGPRSRRSSRWLASPDDVLCASPGATGSSASPTSQPPRSSCRPVARVLLASADLADGLPAAGRHRLAPPRRALQPTIVPSGARQREENEDGVMAHTALSGGRETRAMRARLEQAAK